MAKICDLESARSVQALRKDMRETVRQFCKHFKVCHATITNWEMYGLPGRTHFRKKAERTMERLRKRLAQREAEREIGISDSGTSGGDAGPA